MLYILLVTILWLLVANLSEIGRLIQELLVRAAAVTSDIQAGGPFVIAMPKLSPFGLFFFVVPLLFLWTLDMGYLYYIRGVIKGESLGFRSIFEGFNYFLKTISIRFITTVAIHLGLLFFVAPGLWALCAFSQAKLLLLDHPDRSAFWCLRESMRLMQGHKLEYLLLRISFLGWYLLTLFLYIRLAAQLWYFPYINLTLVCYYNKLTGQGPAEEPEWKRPGMH